MVKRYYRLTLFKDREFKKVINRSHVEFINEDTRKLRVSREISVDFIPDEVFNLMHMVVYERITQQLMPRVQFTKMLCSPEGLRGRFMKTFGFDDDFLADFYDETYVQFEDLVTTLKLSLGD